LYSFLIFIIYSLDWFLILDILWDYLLEADDVLCYLPYILVIIKII